MSRSRSRISTTQAAAGRSRAHATLNRLLLKHGQSFSGHERNCCFLNTGGGKFADISAASGFDFPDDGRALVTVDWDHDGDLDAWVSNRNAPRLRFLRNDTPSDHHYVAIRLVGNGATTNRDAIGARVEVVLGDQESGDRDRESGVGDRGAADSILKNHRRRRVKTLRAGEGFLAQSSKWVHFGLAAASEIDHVRVHWPGGNSETFGGLKVDRRYKLVQGTGVAEPLKAAPRDLALAPSSPKILPPDTQIRIPLIALLSVPEIFYETADGERLVVPAGRGKPLLVNLWASWCRPCLEELSEFARRENDLRKQGIDVLALSVDGLGNNRSDPAAATEIPGRLKFPFRSGRATPELVEMLQTMHDRLITMHLPLPVPTSLLIDGQGRLAVIYKGRVSVDQLLEDAAHASQPLLDRFENSAAVPGRIIRHKLIEDDLQAAAWNTRLLFGMALQQQSRFADAAKQFVQILEVAPNVAEVHTNLGIARHKQGRLADAQRHWERAIQLKGDQPDAHNGLGMLFRGQGHGARAKHHFRRALEVRPDYLEGQNNLAWLLATSSEATVRDGPRALKLAKRAAEQTEYAVAGVLDTLAAACAANSQFNDAVRWQLKAIRMANGETKADFAARLKLYQQGQPYRQSN